MVPPVLIGLLVVACLVSSLLFYVYVRSRQQARFGSLNGQQQRVRYSIRPSIDIVTKRLSNGSQRRSSVQQSSPSRSYHEESEMHPNRTLKSMTVRSASLAQSILPLYRPRTVNWRKCSIVDPNQMALIQFTVPSSHPKYRRRSVAVCNNISEEKQDPIRSNPSNFEWQPSHLLAFHLQYVTSSQLQIQFDSFTPFPSTMLLEQLIIKAKLLPDGKTKYIRIKKPICNEPLLDPNDDDNNKYNLTFANVPVEKLNEKSLLMTVTGKDSHRKTIDFGQIGKIYFNQIPQLAEGKEVDCFHTIEKNKMSSIEALLALQQNNDRFFSVEIQRLKGLKIDQKRLDATCYLRATLLDSHRPLTSHQTKLFRMNSTTLNINAQFLFSLFGFDSTTIDRLMICVSFHANSVDPAEHRCIARVQLASPLFCSGSGTIHWQQFKARQSFSKWHTLIKQS